MLLFIRRLNVLACGNLEALDNSLPLMRKGSKMSVLSRQKGVAALIVQSTKIPLSKRADDRTHNECSLKEFCFSFGL